MGDIPWIIAATPETRSSGETADESTEGNYRGIQLELEVTKHVASLAGVKLTHPRIF
jgi:hypothetical protein